MNRQSSYNMTYSVLFDGNCGLCHQAVSFILKHDVHSEFIYISNLSEQGKKILSGHNLQNESNHTLIVVDKDKNVFLRGKAILVILKKLPRYRHLEKVLRFVPLFLLNLGYRIISRYRRKFGLKTCLIPTPEQADRIIL